MMQYFQNGWNKEISNIKEVWVWHDCILFLKEKIKFD